VKPARGRCDAGAKGSAVGLRGATGRGGGGLGAAQPSGGVSMKDCMADLNLEMDCRWWAPA